MFLAIIEKQIRIALIAGCRESATMRGSMPWVAAFAATQSTSVLKLAAKASLDTSDRLHLLALQYL